MRAAADPIKFSLYQNAFYNVAKANIDKPDPANTKKLIFYGVKMVNTEPKPEYMTEEEAIRHFQLGEAIQLLMGTLTPAEFINIFPITKDFNGHKYQSKDYFYTRDYIRTLPPDEPIGDVEAVMKFLWEYVNWELNEFSVNVFGYADNLRKLEGHNSMVQDWATALGIKAYTMHTDEKGKQFMIDGETGKTIRLKKRIPRYLRAVK